MYDFGPLATANDALWQAVADRLRQAGIAQVPRALDRGLDIHTLWQAPGLLFAQSCGYPLMTALGGRPRIVAVPRYRARGCDGARYGSALVVRADDRSANLADLRGRPCAANQPHSNTGMNLLRAAVAELVDGPAFFSGVLWSGSHRASVELVASGEADVAAIDAVTYAQLGRFAPDLVARTRVLGWTAATYGLPFITAPGTDDATLAALRKALSEACADPALAAVRDVLLLDGVETVPLAAYDEVMALERRAIDRGYPALG